MDTQGAPEEVSSLPSSSGLASDKLKHICAIQTVNEEIIGRISSHQKQGASKVAGYHAVLTFKHQPMEMSLLAEKELTSNTPQTVQSFRPSQELTNIADIFNDKLDYRCNGFHDLVRLNKSMLPVAQKYLLFGGSPESMQYLEQFHENYKRLQDMLGKLDQDTMDVMMDSATEKQVQKHIAEINAAFQKIKDLLGIPQDPVPDTVPDKRALLQVHHMLLNHIHGPIPGTQFTQIETRITPQIEAQMQAQLQAQMEAEKKFQIQAQASHLMFFRALSRRE